MSPLFPPDYPDRPDAPLVGFGPSFSEEISRSLFQAVCHESGELPHEAEVRVAAALTMFEGFHPRDHLECMMAAQGVAAHTGGMECLARAMRADVPEATAIKLRNNAAQLFRSFSLISHDLERRQSKPLPERPAPSPVKPAPPPAGPPLPPPFGFDMSDLEPSPSGSDAPSANECGAQDSRELPEDVVTRPDGTPGSLAAYLPKTPKQVYVPKEPAIMIALATRPKPWRQVTKADPATPPVIEENIPDLRPSLLRGPIDIHEKIFSGDALSQFASARFDPNADVGPLNFDADDSVVELEVISTGGDPEAEAERAAMVAAHPEGKPIVTFRYGGKPPQDKPPDS